jgi:hypothetical protein
MDGSSDLSHVIAAVAAVIITAEVAVDALTDQHAVNNSTVSTR